MLTSLALLASCFTCRVLEQHWDVVEPMSTRADWVSYHYYVGLLKVSEDKASGPVAVENCR